MEALGNVIIGAVHQTDKVSHLSGKAISSWRVNIPSFMLTIHAVIRRSLCDICKSGYDVRICKMAHHYSADIELELIHSMQTLLVEYHTPGDRWLESGLYLRPEAQIPLCGMNRSLKNRCSS